MNDGMLSQDEIDALLRISADEDSLEEKTDFLSNIEKDTIGEIGNISIGSSATTLSTLLNQKVEITTPKVSIITREEISEGLTYDSVNIQVNYIEGFTGQNVLVIKSEDAAIISDIMLGGDGTSPTTELTDIHLSAVQEAMNQMMGSAATSMSTVFGKRVDISPPTINVMEENEDPNPEQFGVSDIFVKVSFELKVGTLIDSCFKQLMPIHFAKQLVNQLLGGYSKEKRSSSEQIEKNTELVQDSLLVNDLEPAKTERAEPNPMHSPQYIGNSIDPQNATIQQAVFSNFEQVELNNMEQRNLDMLLDIPLRVTVELGRTNRTIRDILDLTSGSIIELDKLAGEPVDILVNEKLIARGEVVVIDENFGVRVTDIISQSDRLLKLK